MCKLLLFSFGCLFTLMTKAQYTFVDPIRIPEKECHENVNARSDQNFRNDIKRAVFRLQVSGIGNCSATMLNRNTGQGNLGQYFVTAWHCFKTGSNCGVEEFDFNTPVTMYFNYQSPNSNSQVFAQNFDAQVYRVSRQIRLVDRFSCAYGDFALCEILGDPIPPYFNIYYSGWYPSHLFINANHDFATIHHPSGSIKKITGFTRLSGTGPVGTTCHTVTTIIDFLFGWIWKRRWSTQVICTYAQVPFIGTKYGASLPQFGSIEDGSSGGGLFTGNSGSAGANRFIGDLSSSWPGFNCSFFNFGTAYFGKFGDSYYRQTVKNTLNPPNKYWIDQSGIPGRQISCYPSLNIHPEAGQFAADLFPAKLYQAENNITLSSLSTFVTTGNVRVMPEADFVFQAGQSITLNPGFEVQGNARFTASISQTPCYINESNYRIDSSSLDKTEYEVPDMNKVLSNMPYPIEKKFDIEKYLASKPGALEQNSKFSSFNVFPNPAKSAANVKMFFKEKEEKAILSIYDFNGKLIMSKEYRNVYFINETINTSSLSAGMYNALLKTKSSQDSEKFLITK